jgi:hypothetical protein
VDENACVSAATPMAAVAAQPSRKVRLFMGLALDSKWVEHALTQGVGSE